VPVTSRSDGERTLSLLELTILGLLATRPQHGFALSKELELGGEIGNVYSAHRPAIYRALSVLDSLGLVEDVATERSTRGPSRTLKQATSRGRDEVLVRVDEPVTHMRNVHTELLVKLALRDRLGLDSAEFLRRQIEVLEPLHEEIHKVDPCDLSKGFERVWSTWRWEHSDAIMEFLHRIAEDAAAATSNATAERTGSTAKRRPRT